MSDSPESFPWESIISPSCLFLYLLFLFHHLDLLFALLCSLVPNTHCYLFFLPGALSLLGVWLSVRSKARLFRVVWFRRAVIFHSRHLRGLRLVVWGESNQDPASILLSPLVHNHHYASQIHIALILCNQCSLESPALQEEAQNNLMSDASLRYST